MTPCLSLIAVISADGFISAGEGVPWSLPKDRDHFRAYTQGKWLLLGRKTYEEMLGWFSDHHPLVLSRDAKFLPFLGERVTGIQEALQRAGEAHQPELVVCGGAGGYEAAMPLAERLIITHVDHLLGGGVPFPHFSQQDWEPISRVAHVRDDFHEHGFAIVTYQRVHKYQDAA
ncbi:dihydrofolate reductase [Prosthecobacter fusiformis]|uniref:dihydrofolate reductase n=1 Tax=Prosthecobacter fusiformis TaxID=48464 RepID=A0A4R7SS50_9BACT|nr:dihydrofolate reductase [Prosthecobacter fusiformis]TDU81489.1 dihydrofolate reductase [Prosthecobacter fusiformis]